MKCTILDCFWNRKWYTCYTKLIDFQEDYIKNGGDFMKRKVGLFFGFIGAFALSIGFTSVLAKGQIDVSDGDKIIVVPVEEQEAQENQAIGGKDIKIVITAEEQNRVENSSALSGFVPQQNGTGFFFERVK